MQKNTFAIIMIFGLVGAVYTYQVMEQKKIEKALLIQKQIESERLAKEKREKAEREARERREREEREARERREREEREQLASLSKKYANQAAQQIVESVGGGQDLIVKVRAWNYDRIADELEIEMEIYFNGRIFRSNNYNVNGVLTVKRDGTKPRFSRTYANQNFKDLEDNLAWFGGIVAGVILLNELGNQ